jgi:hypothetical protein
MEKLFFRGQYEIIDQDQALSALAEEAGRRLHEDLAQLGMVPAGQVSEPLTFEAEGVLWIQLEIPVRDAANLLGGAA